MTLLPLVVKKRYARNVALHSGIYKKKNEKNSYFKLNLKEKIDRVHTKMNFFDQGPGAEGFWPTLPVGEWIFLSE